MVSNYRSRCNAGNGIARQEGISLYHVYDILNHVHGMYHLWKLMGQQSVTQDTILDINNRIVIFSRTCYLFGTKDNNNPRLFMTDPLDYVWNALSRRTVNYIAWVKYLSATQQKYCNNFNKHIKMVLLMPTMEYSGALSLVLLSRPLSLIISNHDSEYVG